MKDKPCDTLNHIYYKIRFMQAMLAHADPNRQMELCADELTGFYFLLEDIQEKLAALAQDLQ